MPPEQQEPTGGLRKNLTAALNVCVWTGIVVALLTTRAGTAGHRYLRGTNIGVGVLVLYVWALATKSELLLYGGGALALLSLAEHRLKSARGTGVHSYSMGESLFARRYGEKKGRAVGAFLALALGTVLLTVDEGAGSYLMCGALAHMLTLSFVYGREEAVDQDILDAQIEAASRAGRHHDRPLF